MKRSRFAKLAGAFVAALTAAALLAPALHGPWIHRLAASSDGAGITRGVQVPQPVGLAADQICGACLAVDASRTASQGPSAPSVAALEAAPFRASQPDVPSPGILRHATAAPRAPPLA